MTMRIGGKELKRLAIWVDVPFVKPGGRFEPNPIRKFIDNKLGKKDMLIYEPTRSLSDKLKLTKYDKIYVDVLAKNLLDRTARLHPMIKESQFLQDLDDILTTISAGREVKMVEREKPKTGKQASDYDLIVLASSRNIKEMKQLLSRQS